MQQAKKKKKRLLRFLSILGLLVFTLVGCAGPLEQKDDMLTGYRWELAKLVEAGVLTKDDAEKFYGIASLEMERRAKQHREAVGAVIAVKGARLSNPGVQ